MKQTENLRAHAELPAGHYLFTSESVSEGHPDKVADQISDAVLDNFLASDPDARVACETMVTTGQVVIAGEVTSRNYVDVQRVARQTIARIGYTKADYKFEAESCGILTALHEQSADIALGVDGAAVQGAGDQGMMFGYATCETDNYMPLTLDLAHTLMYTLARIRKEGREMTYLRPDAKSQVTIEYNGLHEPVRIDTVVISTQHDPDITQAQIASDIRAILLPRVAKRDARYAALLQGDFRLLVNPTGQFVIGGPHGDTGLTGRKIIVDTYGGRGAHGGGAFSGKDPSKVDRSAAYAARWIAKNMVAAGVAREMLVQVSYAIGVAEPVSVFVNTFGTGCEPDSRIAARISTLFNLTPAGITEALRLKNPIYEETARYGHVGRTPEVVTKVFFDGNGQPFERRVELFTWEKLDMVEKIRNTFAL
ncbi:MAG: methionine adenosyltransferase [Paludibacteraceae bacterium]|nr:methionine adenosyltransferase [Paludibacteraceae bacterium]